MVEALCGTWELVDSQNMEECMVALGLDFVTRQFGKLATPRVAIALVGDKLVVRTFSSFLNHTISCKLGVEFEEKTVDGRICQSVVTIQGNRLNHVQKWNGKTCCFEREVKDGMMVVTVTCADITAFRKYRRIS